MVNMKTHRKRVAKGSDDLNWLNNKLADEIIDRDEITYYYADKGMSSENISSVPSCGSKCYVLGRKA